ncbi:hypothetical protein HCJ76_03260 [Streptomyces sp. MC1]|uniref:hypothetical protein n=1 Tax=Streptomyces sp. MC1 TaxID=295105 RepID=UPI0018C8E15D|nr:hypothetical protein [Streptomyces sp. MC1]MBG7697141.1 hypothetical protein [Streptomyces sp. MC1]
MTTSTHGDHLHVLGPDSGLARVFASYEERAHGDPSAAWHAFTTAWNWAAPLTTAVPGADVRDRPVARPAVGGGFSLSGLWHLPGHDGTGPWLALPLTAGERPSRPVTATPGGLDLFAVPSKALRAAVHAVTGDADVPGPVFRLEDVHVPTGFVTHAAATPLRAGDAPFLWTAVVAQALGAVRRMTDTLAAADAEPGAARGPRPSAAVAAELAAVLHDERLSLAAALHGAPSARLGLPLSAEERLAARVQRAGNAAHQVVASALDHALASYGYAGEHPLVHLMEASAPILQQVRYATQLLPPDDGTSWKGA